MKDIKINIFKYCKVINPKTKTEIFNLGYIDGYFNEEAYLNFILDKDILTYSKGYIYGKKERYKNDENKINIWKKVWIYKISSTDALNNIPPRNISKEYFEEYISNYNDVKNNGIEEIDSKAEYKI